MQQKGRRMSTLIASSVEKKLDSQFKIALTGLGQQADGTSSRN